MEEEEESAQEQNKRLLEQNNRLLAGLAKLEDRLTNLGLGLQSAAQKNLLSHWVSDQGWGKFFYLWSREFSQ